jgi:hypothetical protein
MPRWGHRTAQRRLSWRHSITRARETPAIIRKEDRLDYYDDSLDGACITGNYAGITHLVAVAAQRSIGLYIDLLGLSGGNPPD